MIGANVEPWQLGAVDAVQLIKSKELSPLELTESLLSRIAAVDDELRAWVTVDAEGAKKTATSLGERLAKGDNLAPAGGLPVGIKDVIHVEGLRTTASSKVLQDFVAAEDATCITALRRGDANILGKVHTAEFACADPSPTRNPWNHEHTPGGSSSGSAAAVAAATVPAALGTQTGGSTLRPAAYNGIVGLKPSYGMISNRGVIPLAWSLDHIGILTRSVGDAALLLATLAGYDVLDPASSVRADSYDPPILDLETAPVIGLITTMFLEICEPEMYAHTREVASKLEAQGAEVREITLAPSYERIAPTMLQIMRGEVCAYHREQFAAKKDLYGPKLSAIIEEGSHAMASDYVTAARERFSVVADLERALQGVDVALTPATPAPAPRNTTHTGDAVFQSPWAYSGMPSMALPSGVNQWGLPLAIQLVGHRFGDADLIRAAHWCEAVLGFNSHPPCWTDKETT